MSKNLSLQQTVLWYSWLYNDNSAAISYTFDNNCKILSKKLKTENEINNLFIKYKSNPMYVSNTMIQCIQKINNDNRLNENEKWERVNRYIHEFINLILAFDNTHYPHLGSQSPVYSWIPNYIPDWLVDLWSDKEKDTEKRKEREKLIIDKIVIYNNHIKFLMDTINKNIDEKQIIRECYRYVWNIEYADVNYYWKEIPLSYIINKGEAVCRHKAMLLQLFMQFFGIDSHLVKCDIKTTKNGYSPHVCNLCYCDWNRFLVDTAQPIIFENWDIHYNIIKIKESEIDLNNNVYERNITKEKIPAIKNEKIYRTRKNMYYEIR